MAAAQKSDDGPSNREQQTFDQQLQHQVNLLGSQRHAHRELAPAIDGAAHHQVGNVGAGDQQNEAHRSKQHQQQRTNVADNLRAQRCDVDADRRILPRICARQLRVECVHLGPRLLQRDAGREPRDDIQPASVPRRGFVIVQVQRHPDWRDAGRTEFEIARQDADHGDRLAIEAQNASHNAGVGGEITAPEVVAEQGDGRSLTFRQVFTGDEIAPQNWAHAQRGKEIGSDHGAEHGLRFPVAAQREGVVSEAAERLETFRGAPPVEEIRIGGAVSAARRAVTGFADRHQLLRIAKRQRTQQNGIHHREDRSVCANRQSQSDDGDCGEAGMLPQHAQSVAKVLAQGSHAGRVSRIGEQVRSHNVTLPGSHGVHEIFAS